MKKNKRSISAFNLSFLDIMFCGFGAVVLLVLIINSNIISDNKKKYQDLTNEVDNVKIEITAAERFQHNLQNKLQQTREQAENIQSEINQIRSSISLLKDKKDVDREKTLALKAHINSLQNELKQLDKQNRQQKKKVETYLSDSDNKVRQYEGEGNRQYLSGLKLGGKRVLILLDSSASMLDDTIVNIIVKRNLSDEVKRSTKKWQQTINIVRWLAANLPKNSQVIIASFNNKFQSLAKNQSMQWQKSIDNAHMNTMFKKLSRLIPQQGTSLYKAFSEVRKMMRKPDNIILITDGLPTMGRTKTTKTKVSPSERIELFQQAIKLLPSGIPVNTILLPMEGDPMAASLFWQLAIDSKGSFMTPSQDWP